MNNKHNPKLMMSSFMRIFRGKSRILQSLNKLKGHILNLYALASIPSNMLEWIVGFWVRKETMGHLEPAWIH